MGRGFFSFSRWSISGSNYFGFDLSSHFTYPGAQVVELGMPNLTQRLNIDGSKNGTLDGNDAFDTDAGTRNFAHSEGLVGGFAFDTDDYAREDLITCLVAFGDFKGNIDSVADVDGLVLELKRVGHGCVRFKGCDFIRIYSRHQ